MARLVPDMPLSTFWPLFIPSRDAVSGFSRLAATAASPCLVLTTV